MIAVEFQVYCEDTTCMKRLDVRLPEALFNPEAPIVGTVRVLRETIVNHGWSVTTVNGTDHEWCPEHTR